MSENRNINSEEYQTDLLLTFKDDPMAKDDEFWPELNEWCSSCKSTRKVKFVLEGREKTGMANPEEKVTSLEQIEEGEVEEEVKEERERVASSSNDSACSKLFEMQLDISKQLLKEEEEVKTTIFWRPWENSCEATADLNLSCDATTLLSSEPITPPLLVTPSCRSRELEIGEIRLSRNMKRLLDFQSTLEREKGLPPSQWLRRLERGEATPVPVSHRNQMMDRGSRRRRREMGDAEASSPILRGGLGGMGAGKGECLILPLGDNFSEIVNASRTNLSMLHTTPLAQTGWQRRAFCWGCGSWGNMIPMS